MKYILILLLISTALEAVGQEKTQWLLVSEYHIDTDIVHLVSYNFKNGVYISKDTILNAAQKYYKEKTPYNMGFGTSSLIYQNRYVVAQFGGGVLDMKTKKIMYKENVKLEALQGDTLVYYPWDDNFGKGYVSLDLKSGEYEWMTKESSWYKRKHGPESPDKKYYLTIDKRQRPYKICLNDEERNQRILVKDAGQGIYTKGSQSPTIETHWLNNHSFLYEVHEPKKDSTNNKFFCSVYLRKYDISNHSDSLFYKLDTVSVGIFNGRFHKDGIDQIIYRATSGKRYIIDTVKNEMIDYPKYYRISPRFSLYRTEVGTTFKYEDNEIGTIWEWGNKEFEQGEQRAFTQSSIAVKYRDSHSTLSQGIKVWTKATNKWVTFDNIPRMHTIVGWIEEEDK